MATPGPRILIAGGGTGGHLFPGLAIAEALRERAPGVVIRFAGSAYGLESRVVPAQGYRLYRIPVRGLYAVPLRRKLWVAAMLPFAFLKCVGVLLSYRPHLIIGVGGYASAPILATGLLLGFRCVIQEQNAYPGLTNRLLGRFVHTAFVSVEDTQGFFHRSVVTGTPVREAIRALRREARPGEGGGPPRPPGAAPLLFVFGGSQGANVINRALVDALPCLEGRPLRILHQTGPRDLEWVRQAYLRTELEAEVVPFLEDMAAAYRRCRLIVSRSGASAVNEIVTAGRASVLIPIPHTSGEHQLRNAQRVQAAGAGLVIEQHELSGERLARTLTGLLDAPERIDAMERACDALYPGDAAGRIAAACLALA